MFSALPSKLSGQRTSCKVAHLKTSHFRNAACPIHATFAPEWIIGKARSAVVFLPSFFDQRNHHFNRSCSRSCEQRSGEIRFSTQTSPPQGNPAHHPQPFRHTLSSNQHAPHPPTPRRPHDTPGPAARPQQPTPLPLVRFGNHRQAQTYLLQRILRPPM